MLNRLLRGLEEIGYVFSLLIETIFWIFWGWRRSQPLQLRATVEQMRQIGVDAIPIVTVLSFTIGVMLAVQGIHTLRNFGAEILVILGITKSVTREFAPLIIGILIAGRSGSALAARTGTMQVSQEIDALRVMGINPVRYLVAPVLVAIVLVLPALTFFADMIGLLGGALYSVTRLDIGLETYASRTLEILRIEDLMHGLWKSVVFAVIITLIGFSNGFSVSQGAEGVGKATTRSVVLSITCIIITDMLFSFYLTH